MAARAPAQTVRRMLRSFVRRNGRTTVAQARAQAEVGPQFLLPYQPFAIDLIAAYADPTRACPSNDQKMAPLILEIGFGMGEATAQIAALLPETHFLCCEVHQAGIGALLKRIDEQQLRNIRIIAHDAVEVLAQMLESASLDRVHVFFPDPWHKKRHHKRRLIQSPLVALVADRLKPGGTLHCATDWQPYAQQMLEVLQAEPRLRNCAGVGNFALRPAYRPLTKFENRGLRLGHGVWDLLFERL